MTTSSFGAHAQQGRLVEQRPVHLYDPVNDLVNYELRERYSIPEIAH